MTPTIEGAVNKAEAERDPGEMGVATVYALAALAEQVKRVADYLALIVDDKAYVVTCDRDRQ